MNSYLYIMEAPDAIKIGYSHSPVDRRASVATQWKVPLNLKRTYRLGDDPASAEAAVHAKLAGFRRNAEWFELSVEDAHETISRMGFEECDPPKSKASVFRFSDDELRLLERHAQTYGSLKGALMAGLHALDAERPPVTKADVLAWVEEHG
ncbi:hypothetical protein D1227_06555 [Henriciella mobilis]|uniref:GIY-YIG nuclease family protein n=1 Tax=Henriciella mobilis TaxID=2305467 RepID=UPI000E67538C|nr:GIY-YIG nuclease family protein [Henriciella mobilis]RIJ15930.1 hypothetical protein D1231_09045 [Henriciella mobilis]RIJ21140.1 hypothetical protein D1227_12585 [Henriciella mobilis]RIJ23160.1 hypothetical protein D1227_06555 [Henriciella mobilis]